MHGAKGVCSFLLHCYVRHDSLDHRLAIQDFVNRVAPFRPQAPASFCIFWHLCQKFCDVNDRPVHSSAANLPPVIPGGYTHGIKLSIERLEHCLSLDPGPDSACRAVLDVDRGTDRDLIAFALRMQSVKCGGL